jgi:LacI family transcriptional regulator
LNHHPEVLSSSVRERAFFERARERSLDSELRMVAAELSEEGGYRAGLDLLTSPDPPTAIATLADVVALGVLRAAHERGIKVPHDLSVVGYDDVSIAGHPLISLTTVSPRPGGQKAGTGTVLSADALLERIAGRTTPRHEQFQPRLVVRSSTAAPPAAAGGRRSRS